MILSYFMGDNAISNDEWVIALAKANNMTEAQAIDHLITIIRENALLAIWAQNSAMIEAASETKH